MDDQMKTCYATFMIVFQHLHLGPLTSTKQWSMAELASRKLRVGPSEQRQSERTDVCMFAGYIFTKAALSHTYTSRHSMCLAKLSLDTCISLAQSS